MDAFGHSNVIYWLIEWIGWLYDVNKFPTWKYFRLFDWPIWLSLVFSNRKENKNSYPIIY